MWPAYPRKKTPLKNLSEEKIVRGKNQIKIAYPRAT
jgi:hypothetical protein